MKPNERLAALAGRWRIARVIRHADGGTARMRGTAEWLAEGVGLRCVEEGMLEQDGRPFAARRETLWRATAGAIDVRFADGRPFHVIDGGTSRHDCAPDLYELRYDFAAWPHWSVRWRVVGPRKNYRALTRYCREA
ncbi:hypothetical protein JSE7799_02359 [Jannaschia seosinensis]|uniref:DUF6314 domain-containing protein n=1 Tax=Jannaschia seosinensis TaxID=313367 RepID=A0A0M7BCU1_9RHOB|nr:DUF6314 family protein [Jannaschia seosinensis]CUH39632.1 hypothetical protein JSE7799_02359 [Jannaschia seosinensis]